LNRVIQSVGAKRHRFKVGHTGTLDPFAEGILVASVGRATRMLDAMSLGQTASKEYLATVRLGLRTDTNDILGGCSVCANALHIGDMDV